jgi:hypothetical protein
MPLNIRVIRNNETVSDFIWDGVMLSFCYTVAIKEQRPDFEYAEGKTFGDLPEGKFVDFSNAPIYYLTIPGCPLVERGEQTLLYDHSLESEDHMRQIHLKAGDRIEAWRS